MSDQASDSLHGLACPQCGGMVPIPEGQVIVKCPYCDLRSLVRGERGMQRYQVPRRIERQQAIGALQKFLTGNYAIALDAAKNSRLSEAFVAYLPFWANWSRVLSWVFGQKRVRSNKTTTYRPREVRVVQDMLWNNAACDVREFGVTTVPLSTQPLEAFDPDLLHETGMVFEPVGSTSEARSGAEADFQKRIHDAAKLDRIGQVFVRFLRQRMGLVYYPLWVMRYLYRGRSFQVAVDGYTGMVLYGKAPGNTLYRAAVLVGGMLLGAFMAIDLPAICFWLGIQAGDDAEGIFVLGVGLLIAGFVLIGKAYTSFRYGEEYEFNQGKKKKGEALLDVGKMSKQIEELSSWLDQ
ncbi:MAG TPA: hypothetical protein PKM21_07640 [Anaerolineales bacterium]|nr:hypothetical protein [Anaerolineales bacterium]